MILDSLLDMPIPIYLVKTETQEGLNIDLGNRSGGDKPTMDFNWYILPDWKKDLDKSQ